MRNKYGVAIYRDERFNQHGFAHLTFRFVWLNTGYGAKELFEVQWQSDNRPPQQPRFREWYGGDIQLKVASVELLELASRLAKRLYKDWSVFNAPPAQVLEVVASMRDVTRVLYDSRVSKYLPLAEVKPAEWGRWRDVNNQVSVVAFDEDHARDELDKALQELVEKGYVSKVGYAQWIVDGSQVQLYANGGGPKVLSDEQAIRPIGGSLDEEE